MLLTFILMVEASTDAAILIPILLKPVILFPVNVLLLLPSRKIADVPPSVIVLSVNVLLLLLSRWIP